MTGPIAPVIPVPARRRGPTGEPAAGFLRTRRTLPLPTLAAVRDRHTRYRITAMDDRGRIADRTIVAALGWTTDATMAAEPSDSGVILVRPAVGVGCDRARPGIYGCRPRSATATAW